MFIKPSLLPLNTENLYSPRKPKPTGKPNTIDLVEKLAPLSIHTPASTGPLTLSTTSSTSPFYTPTPAKMKSPLPSFPSLLVLEEGDELQIPTPENKITLAKPLGKVDLAKKPKFAAFASQPSPQAILTTAVDSGDDVESSEDEETPKAVVPAKTKKPNLTLSFQNSPLALSTDPEPSESSLEENLTPKGEALVRAVREAEEMIGMKRLVPKRGNYRAFTFENLPLGQMLSNPTITACINEYSESPKTMEDIQKQNMKTAAFVKPGDEVRAGKNCPNPQAQQSKLGIPPELEAINERAAKILFSLPQTVALANVTSTSFYDLSKKPTEPKTKMAVVIEAMKGKAINELDENLQENAIAAVSLHDFQQMALLDLGLHNTDRNAGNVLISKNSDGTAEIVPIDHANILPAKFASNCTFTWMNWPQSRLPFSEQSLATIRSLDAQAGAQVIKDIYPDYPQANLDIMETSYYLLKQGARYGLTPFQIGLFYTSINVAWPSLLANIYDEAKKIHESLQTPNKPSVSALMNLCITNVVQHLVANPEIMSNQAAWENAKLPDLVKTFF